MSGELLATLVFAALALLVLKKTAVVVPQQSAYVVERLGKYSSTLNAGLHILVPFIDVIRYKHSLKELALDVPEQICITKDNVQVGVDGVLYIKVLDAERASYGITDFRFAISQLAQTTLRSEIGKIDLDRTFEERSTINVSVVNELDKASAPWGVKVMRYEIRNINPPQDVVNAMEKQMRAEREKRAVVLTSEGQRDAAINEAEGKNNRSSKPQKPNGNNKSMRPRAKHQRFWPLPLPLPKGFGKWQKRYKIQAATRPCNFAWPSNISGNLENWPKPATRWCSPHPYQMWDR